MGRHRFKDFTHLAMPISHASRQFALRLLLLTAFSVQLAACDQLGIETPAQTAARQEAEGKAIGGACRQTGRALEDCYRASPRTSKAAIYAGWRDMDAYMRDNKIETVPTEEERAAQRERTAEMAAPATPPAPASATPAATPAPEAPMEAKPAGKSGKQS